jgi:hypothetical protein
LLRGRLRVLLCAQGIGLRRARWQLCERYRRLRSTGRRRDWPWRSWDWRRVWTEARLQRIETWVFFRSAIVRCNSLWFEVMYLLCAFGSNYTATRGKKSHFWNVGVRRYFGVEVLTAGIRRSVREGLVDWRDWICRGTFRRSQRLYRAY